MSDTNSKHKLLDLDNQFYLKVDNVVKKKPSGESKLAADANILSGLVDYQENSVVSRTLIDKKVGTVTLFAFDADQGLSEHTAPFDALLYVFDGEAEATISGKPIHLKSGMITLLPVGKPHSVRALSRFKMMLIMIRS
jgi:quercetin dioxygenase-like cupin family protein